MWLILCAKSTKEYKKIKLLKYVFDSINIRFCVFLFSTVVVIEKAPRHVLGSQTVCACNM